MYKIFYNDILNQIDDTTIIISSTHELANRLLYDCLKLKKHRLGKSIIKKCIFSIKDWLDYLWSQTLLYDTNLPYVISDSEALFIISQILKKKLTPLTLNADHPKDILSTWQLLCHWRLDLSDLSSNVDHYNTQQFLECAKPFKMTCQTNNWIDQSQRLNVLSKSRGISKIFRQRHIQKLYFVGFDTMAPDLKYFITQLLSLGVKTKSWKPPIKKRSCIKFYQYQDKSHELISVAQLVKKYSARLPSKSIGVIIPDLQDRFLDVQTIFDEYFMPKHLRNSPLIDNSHRRYTISGGIKLIEMPIVFQLLQWLTLSEINNFDEIMTAFTSPYIVGGLKFLHPRKKLIFYVKNTCSRKITIKQLVKNQSFQEHADAILRKIVVVNQVTSRRKLTAISFVSSIKKKNFITRVAW